ncbi:hypothetical protein THAOC_20977, partial [Thalassiosira oceanica]
MIVNENALPPKRDFLHYLARLPTCRADRERAKTWAGDEALAKRRVSLIFSAFNTDERARNGDVGKSSIVLANAAAGRDERHRLTTSAERRRNLGKDDRTMFDIVAMRQGKAA